MRDWTPEDDGKISYLLSQGKTRKQIAVHFGVTRNAICGRVHRLGKCEGTAMVEEVQSDTATEIEFDALLEAVPVYEPPVAPPPRSVVLRISPEDVPLDVRRFSPWADYACVEWPPGLMAASFYACDALRYGKNPNAFPVFLENYTTWFDLPEQQKLALMTQGQRDSPRRSEYLTRARNAVLIHQ